MYFNAAYQIICSVPSELLEKVNTEIKKTLTEEFYTYQDFDAETKGLSWIRVDFMQKPADERLIPLYNSIQDVINHLKNSAVISTLNSVSLSLLKPKQVLAEHTDGRFIHRITDRYLVPLMASKVNYNYGYFNDEKVIYPLEYGKIYRVNNAIIHSALNLEDEDRYNILIDTFDSRLKEKFGNHPDLFSGLTVLGVNAEFEKRKPVLKALK